jgi:DNA-binding beta-propeller fold protein YncE
LGYRTPLPRGSFVDPPRRQGVPAPAAILFASLLGVLALLLAGLLGGIRYQALWDNGRAGEAPVQSAAEFLGGLAQPVNDEWVLPAAVVRLGGSTFVLDTGNRRVLALDEDGFATTIFEDFAAGPPWAVAMTTDGDRLLVAAADEVLVISPAGDLEKNLRVRAGTAAGRPPRLVGIAADAGGRIIVSDAENHRVLVLDGDGNLLSGVGMGMRADGRDGFNSPGAVAVDGAGDIFVADVLNGRIVKLSAQGEFLREFGELGVTEGTLSRTKGLAVDSRGRIHASDGLQVGLSVFAGDGTYLRLVRSPFFESPAGVWLEDDRLYVIDRFAGLIILRLP